MKKAIYIISGIIVVVLLHLSFRYILNEIYINKYKQSNYDNGIINLLQLINVPEEYISYYNKGNNYYNLGKYAEAEKEYREALKTVKGDRRCKVNINLAFTRLKIVVDKSTNTAEVDDLKSIQKILLDDDCATTNNNGKNKDSQEFYNYLEELIKNARGDPNGGGDDPGDPTEEDPPSEEQYKEIEEKIRQQQIDTQKERNKRNNKREYNYHKGKTW